VATAAIVDNLLVIADIARTVNDFRPLEETLNDICVRVSGLQGYDSTAIFMPRQDGDALVLRGSWGLSDAYVRLVNYEHPLRLLGATSEQGLSPSAEAFRSGHLLAIPDTDREPTLDPWRFGIRREQYRSLVCVPIIVRSQVIGVLDCYGHKPHQHSREELDVLQLISRLAGIAIETARIADCQRAASAELRRLTDRLQEQNHELSQLSSIQARLTQQLVQPDATAVERTARTLAEITGRAVLVAGRNGNPIAHVGPAQTRHAMAAVAARREVSERLRRDQLVAAGGATCVRLGLPETPMGVLVIAPELEDDRGTPALAAVHAAAVVTAELLAERADRALETYARPAALLALANGLYGPDEAREAAGVLGIPADADVQIAVVRCSTGESAQRLSRRLDNLRWAGWPAITATHTGQDVLVLLTTAPAPTLRRACVRTHDQRPEVDRIGVSASVLGLCELPAAVRAARLAAAIDDGLGTLFEDLGPYGSLLGDLPLARAQELVDRTLGPLLRQDRSRGTRLVETLRAYIEHSGRIQAAAVALGIHPNTMHQRLHRIDQLTQIDIHEYRSLGSLVLALEWDRMMRARESVADRQEAVGLQKQEPDPLTASTEMASTRRDGRLPS
jgi:GAF domain-containing protein